MTDIRSKIYTLYSLEQLAGKDTVVHRLHPAAKLTATAVYILCVASMGRYSFFAMTPYVFYPCIVLALAELPFGMVFRRTLIALPFCLFAGISNLIFDRSVAFWLGGIPITGGILSVFTILLRALLCVSAVLILVAVTPLSALTGELRCLHVPGVFVSLFEMVYRYIGTLLEEAADMRTAYQLRRGTKKGISLADAGMLIGQLFLRSADRAARIYNAMKCRGYPGTAAQAKRTGFTSADWAFVLLCCGAFAAVRLGLFSLLFY